MKIFNLLFLLFILFSSPAFGRTDTSSVNPFFRDSVLTHKVDSTKWAMVMNGIDYHRNPGNVLIIQHQKHAAKSKAFFFIFTGILVLLLLLRLVFDDFSFSLLEGMISMKQFFIFYKSKKYDSFLAILFIYILKILLLSLITYIGLKHLSKDDFTHFNYIYFLDILIVLSIFFTVKNLFEFVFNVVIDMQETFKAFFLQNLFAEFVLSLLLLILLLIFVYNGHVSAGVMGFLVILSFSGYIVFNIVRSYQLTGNVRIPYKLHFFLYICAFKILPLLLLAKYILSNVG